MLQLHILNQNRAGSFKFFVLIVQSSSKANMYLQTANAQGTVEIITPLSSIPTRTANLYDHRVYHHRVTILVNPKDRAVVEVEAAQHDQQNTNKMNETPGNFNRQQYEVPFLQNGNYGTLPENNF